MYPFCLPLFSFVRSCRRSKSNLFNKLNCMLSLTLQRFFQLWTKPSILVKTSIVTHVAVGSSKKVTSQPGMILLLLLLLLLHLLPCPLLLSVLLIRFLLLRTILQFGCGESVHCGATENQWSVEEYFGWKKRSSSVSALWSMQRTCSNLSSSKFYRMEKRDQTRCLSFPFHFSFLSIAFLPFCVCWIGIFKVNTMAAYMRMVAKMHNYSMPALFNSGVQADARNPWMNIFILSQGGLTLPNKDFYVNQDSFSVLIRNAITNYMASTFIAMGGFDSLNFMLMMTWHFSESISCLDYCRTDHGLWDNSRRVNVSKVTVLTLTFVFLQSIHVSFRDDTK